MLASVAEEDDFETEDVEGSPKIHRRSVSFAKETLPEIHGLQRRDSSFSISDYEGTSGGRWSSAAGPPIVEDADAEVVTPEDADVTDEEERPLLLNNEPQPAVVQPPVTGEAQSKAERVRGEIFGVLGIALIAFAWIFFIGTAFLRLRAKKDRS